MSLQAIAGVAYDTEDVPRRSPAEQSTMLLPSLAGLPFVLRKAPMMAARVAAVRAARPRVGGAP